MTISEMRQRIQQSFPEAVVEVYDLTGTHDHYEVSVFTPEFQKLTRVEQHKSIFGLFERELKSGEVHALSIKTSSKPTADLKNSESH